VDYLVELGGTQWRLIAESLNTLAAALKKLGQVLVCQVEEEVDRLQSVFLGGLNQTGRETRLGQNDPDSCHGRRAWAQMEGDINVIVRQAEGFELATDLFVDLGVIRRAAELNPEQIGFQTARGLLQPGTVGLGEIKLVIGEQAYLVERGMRLNCRCNRAEIVTPRTLGAVVISLTYP
jgi:hypothetical protein